MKEKLEEKLKSVLHRRKKSTPTQSPRASYEHSEQRSPIADQFSSSPSQPRQPVSDHANHDSRHAGRNRLLSSSYEHELASNAMTSQPTHAKSAQSHNKDPNSSIADDYKSYLPVLDSVDDSNAQQNAALGGDRRPMKSGYGEHKAERNVSRHRASSDAGRAKPLPKVPSPEAGRGAIYYEAPSSSSRRRPEDADSEGEAPQPPPHKFIGRQDMAVKSTPGLTITADQQNAHGAQDWKAKQQTLLEGVVDLNNTVDMDRDVQVAPGKLLSW
jgi:hypothetical protein